MRVSVVEMGGQSSSVATLSAMVVVMMAMLITHTHCFSINQTITVSYSAECDGLNDDMLCLTGPIDLDSDEFMLDSEFSRRILGTIRPSDAAKNPGKAASCDRIKKPNCKPPRNNKPPSVDCRKAPHKRECWGH
ncbi:hypothetical protein M0R45_025029 [Rubus argutus]|uniref:Uncharacterized protein n=1 Tax=Rubus argutus TaxID=59490 RepID=A0AAW1WT63_RUBAR